MGVALSRLSGGLKMHGKFYKIFLDHKLSDAKEMFFKYTILNFAKKIV